MRKKSQKQMPLMPPQIDHPQAEELSAISCILDGNPLRVKSGRHPPATTSSQIPDKVSKPCEFFPPKEFRYLINILNAILCFFYYRSMSAAKILCQVYGYQMNPHRETVNPRNVPDTLMPRTNKSMQATGCPILDT